MRRRRSNAGRKRGDVTVYGKPPLPIKIGVYLREMQGVKALRSRHLTIHGTPFLEIEEAVMALLRSLVAKNGRGR